MAHNHKLHILGFGVVCLLTLFTFCFSSFASSSDMVDLSEYLVNYNEELTWEYYNVECPLRERKEINMANISLTRPIPIEAYSAIYSIDFPRTTIQYANSTEYDVTVLGRIYITGLLQIQTPDGYEWIYSDTKSISVNNNNQYGDIPRFTYNSDPLTFFFDLAGFDNCSITRFQIQFEFYNARTDNTYYTFFVRHQITEFYASPFNLSDLGGQLSGAIDNQTDSLLNAGSEQSQDVIENVTTEQNNVTSQIDDLLQLVPVPNVNEIVLSPSVAGGVLAVNQVFDVFFESLGDKTEATVRLLILCGSVIGVLGLTGMVVGLSNQAKSSSNRSDRVKYTKKKGK